MACYIYSEWKENIISARSDFLSHLWQILEYVVSMMHRNEIVQFRDQFRIVLTNT